MTEKSKIIATWHIELCCHCPKCEEYVNICANSDFFDMAINLGEHDTDRANSLEVQCPICNHKFEVCCEY
jgi:hypothetical protein